jgi:class 3 adenylate cyclase/tetratricopeptide (TPR) repeat protein
MTEAGAASERGIITVLSVDMVDSTRHIADCEPDDAQAFFDRWFDHVTAAVERAGGLLINFGGDGGLAIFGWPSPLEDHADRACMAAWDLQQGDSGAPGPDGTAIHFRVGVHSGLVSLRQLERHGGARFDTAGVTVNVAAKLQQAAPPGGILVSAQTVRLSHAPLALAAHPALPSASLAAIEAFRLEGRPDEGARSDSRSRFRLPIIGRRKELARLVEAIPATGGGCASVALVGEAGIGKSRLAAALVAETAARELKPLIFYGDPQKRTTPFAAARSFVIDLLQLHGDIAPQGLAVALADRRLDASLVSAIETLLISLPTSGRARTALTQTQIARALAAGVVEMIRRQPTVLLVEDFHLVDLESRQFLRYLAEAETAQPLMLLVTARTEAARDLRDTVRILMNVDPLPREDMQELGRRTWPEGLPLGWMLDRIVDRAEGLPLVLEELVHSIDRDASAYQPLPHRIESAIHARLHRLSPSARGVAQALSLLGEADLELVRAVVGCGMGELLNDLSELERFAFIAPLAGRSARIGHQIIAEACADTIPRERRRRLHRAARDAIIARHGQLEGIYEQLAYHAEGAGEDTDALAYLWSAGLEARRKSATASLDLIFDRAVGLIERIGPPAEGTYVDFVLMACASLVQLGEFEKMNPHLTRTLELSRRHERPDRVCSAMAHLGMICWFEGRYSEGLEVAEDGLRMARAMGSPPLIFAHQLMVANILHDAGQLDRAIEVERELCDFLTGELETARLGAPAIPRSMALSFLGWFMPEVGRYTDGVEYTSQGLAIALRGQDAYGEILARNAMARNLQMLGRNDEAVALLAIARELAETTGYDAIKANIAGRTAITLSRVGRAGEAVAIARDCLDRGLHLRAGQMEVYYLYAGYTEALAKCGEQEQALLALESAVEIAQRIQNPSLMVDALGIRACLLAAWAPADPRLAADLAERDEICRRFGLAAWPVPAWFEAGGAASA